MDETIEKLKDKNVILITNKGFRYEGTITDTGPLFLTIKQKHNSTESLIALNTIEKITIIDEEK